MTKNTRASRKKSVISISVGILLLVVGAIFLLFGRSQKTDSNELALADRSVAQNQVELCSPYAGLCFTRPATWTRSKILHVKGSADTTIEINPPTGTILQFAKLNNDTNTNCDKNMYAECTIMTHKVERISNDLNVVTGMLSSTPSPDTCMDSCLTPQVTPFVQLMTTREVTAKGLQKNVPPYDSFNPGVGLRDNQKVYVRITPGKSFSMANAHEWLEGSEAKAAEGILRSTRPY